MGAFKLPGYYISDPVFLQNKKQLVRKMQSEFRTLSFCKTKSSWYERCKANFGPCLFAKQKAAGTKDAVSYRKLMNLHWYLLFFSLVDGIPCSLALVDLKSN